VETPVAAINLALKQAAVEDIARDKLGFRAVKPAQIASLPHQRLDAVTLSDKLVDKVGADKAGGACDKTFHNTAKATHIFVATRAKTPQKVFHIPLLDLAAKVVQLRRVVCR
jgi:hypothetical protein